MKYGTNCVADIIVVIEIQLIWGISIKYVDDVLIEICIEPY